MSRAGITGSRRFSSAFVTSRVHIIIISCRHEVLIGNTILCLRNIPRAGYTTANFSFSLVMSKKCWNSSLYGSLCLDLRLLSCSNPKVILSIMSILRPLIPISEFYSKMPIWTPIQISYPLTLQANLKVMQTSPLFGRWGN